MLRALLSGVFCLAIVGLVSAEADKAAGKTVKGGFKAYKDGTLTINVKGKKGEADKATDFKVADDFKVTVLSGADKKDSTAKEAFGAAKEGTPVAVTSEGDKVTTVAVGTGAPKKKDK